MKLFRRKPSKTANEDVEAGAAVEFDDRTSVMKIKAGKDEDEFIEVVVL